MTRVLLLRHAAHDNVGGFLAGRKAGIHLGVDGQAQARRLGERMKREGIDFLGTSPRERARETAAAVSACCALPPAEIIDALDEIDFGEWSGQTFDQLNHDARWRFWNDARGLARTPAGERMIDVQARALGALDALERRWGGSTIAVVSHADVIKAVVFHHLGIGLEGWWRLEVSPASITTLDVEAGRVRLTGLNERVD